MKSARAKLTAGKHRCGAQASFEHLGVARAKEVRRFSANDLWPRTRTGSDGAENDIAEIQLEHRPHV
jgi:hypothetical protein